MSIDQIRYLREVRQATKLLRAAISDLTPPLLEQGFVVPGFLMDPARFPHQYSLYGSGKIFFERVFAEIEKSLSFLDTLSKKTISSDGAQTQRVFDEVSLRQRKLFETMLATTILSRDAIYGPIGGGSTAAPNPALYYLHYHLSQERDYLQYRNKDLVRYFGGICQITKGQDNQRELVMDMLLNVYGIDRDLCAWQGDARAQFENIIPITTPLEKTALGFGYQQVFGAASSQVHLNMCVFYDPVAKPRELLIRVDNLMLLLVTTVLRLVRIGELAHQVVGLNSQSLRNEFSGASPTTYLAAVSGAGVVGDIVGVFERPDFFLALVEDKHGGTGTVTTATARLASKVAGEAAKADEAARIAAAAAQEAAQAAAATPATTASVQAARDAANKARQESQKATQAQTAAAAAIAPAPAAVVAPPFSPLPIPATAAQIAQAQTAATQAHTDSIAAAAAAAAAAISANNAAAASAEYVSYTIQPMSNVGRRGSFTDVESTIIMKGVDIPGMLTEAVAAGYITQATVQSGTMYAFMRVLESDAARNDLIEPRSNAANTRVLYFVQRYIESGRLRWWQRLFIWFADFLGVY